jgi:hypothetical protein
LAATGKIIVTNLQIIRVKGREIEPYLNELAALRINIFRDYPYLYVGDMDYEKEYLNTYLSCPESTMIIVLDNGKVVGASTAIPMQFETDEFKTPFIKHDMNVDEVFYFGESVLLSEYRGKNIYREFFKGREAAAREFGSRITTFCAVDRDENDSRKPQGYKPLDVVWSHFGYTKHPELYAHFSWKEIGETKETPKRLTFWMKTL